MSCQICGVDDSELYARENGYRAVRCRRCGLVYVNPRPSMEEMKALYDGQETKVTLRRHVLSRARSTVEARESLRFIREHAAGGRLLEIGSAGGYLLRAARDAGFDVQGLDVTRAFVEFSRDVLGVPAVEGTLRDAPFQPGSFDVVYHRNVMSHLAYPGQELQRMAELLGPGGVLVLETGNVAEIPATLAGELELPDHLHHFSEQNLRTLLERAGLRWLGTRRFALVSQLPWMRRLRELLHRVPVSLRRSEPTGDGAPERVARMPPLRLGEWLEAEVDMFVRYRLGSLVPGHGRRCTLVMVGRRP